MPTYTKQQFSGSTSGRPIQVASTSSPGTTIHTVGTATGTIDECYIYASNLSAGNITLNLELGTTATDSLVRVTIPSQDTVFCVPGIPLSATTSIIKAYSTATSICNVYGFVNRAV